MKRITWLNMYRLSNETLAEWVRCLHKKINRSEINDRGLLP